MLFGRPLISACSQRNHEMKEPKQLRQQSPGGLADPQRERCRRRATILFMAAWTVFVLLALWWLLRGGGQDLGPADWVIQDGDSPKTAFGRARDWFRLDREST